LDHEEAKTLLSDYVMGELSSEEAAALKEHTSDCQECREILTSMGIVKQELQVHGPVLFEPHPDAESLVDFALEGQSLTTEDLAAIGAHVRACPTCREEVDVTRRAYAHPQKWWRKLVSPFLVPSFMTTPAFQLVSAVLVLALAYPAYRGLERELGESTLSDRDGTLTTGDLGPLPVTFFEEERQRWERKTKPRLSRSDTPTISLPRGLGGIPNLLFDERTRGSTGGDDAYTVVLEPTQAHLSFLLPMPTSFVEDPRMIEATITRLDVGAAVFHHVGLAADCLVSGFRIARANLLVPTSFLPPGKFRIALHEAGRADGADIYEFEVVAR